MGDVSRKAEHQRSQALHAQQVCGFGKRSIRVTSSVKALAGTIVWAAGATIFFRLWIFQNLLPGDRGDTSLVIFILEHWNQWFHGNRSLLDPYFFYPVKDTLGYSDAYVLLAPLYSMFRVCFDEFASVGFLILTLSLLGYIGFALLLRIIFAVPSWIAIGGAFVFAFNNILSFKILHIQNYAVMLAPWCWLLLFTSMQCTSRLSGIFAATGGGLLLALLFSTSFIITWFFAIFTGTGILFYASNERKLFVPTAMGFGFALGIIVFLYIYQRSIAAGYARTLGEIYHFAPRPIDMFNIRFDNFVWYKIINSEIIGRLKISNASEKALGFTPLLFTLALLGFGALAISTDVAPKKHQRVYLLGVVLIMTILMVLQFKWGSHYYWGLVLKTIPGATGIRTTFRAQVVNLFVLAVLACLFLSLISRHFHHRPLIGRMFTIALMLWMCAEQISRAPAFDFDVRSVRSALNKIPSPPPSCVAFVYPYSPQRDWWLAQGDALLISVRRDIPTINGYSSVFPRGWNLLFPNQNDYLKNVRDWINVHDLKDKVCWYKGSLDLPLGWAKYTN